MRASFEERDAYLDHLAKSYADGRLDDAEFERRRDAILSAATHAEISQQFEGLPAPAVRVPERGRLNRRNVLIGGGVIAAAGVVGALVVSQRTASRPVPTSAADPWAGPPLSTDFVLETLASLREIEFTNLVEFDAQSSHVWGRAQSAKSPGIVSDFEMARDQPLTIPFEAAEEIPLGFEVDAFETMFKKGMRIVTMDHSGEPHSVSLEWGAGEPIIRITFADDSGLPSELLLYQDGRNQQVETPVGSVPPGWEERHADRGRRRGRRRGDGTGRHADDVPGGGSDE